MTSGIELAWILEKLWAVLFVIVWYWKVRLDKKSEKIDEEVKSLREFQKTSNLIYATKSELGPSIQKELEPYRDNQKEVKLLLKALSENIISLSKEVAIQQAIGNLNDSNRQ